MNGVPLSGAKRRILVDNGQFQRPIRGESIFLVDCRAHHLVDEEHNDFSGILGIRPVEEHGTGINIGPS